MYVAHKTNPMQVMCADVIREEAAQSGCRTRFESPDDVIQREMDVSSKSESVIRYQCPVCEGVLRRDFGQLF